MMKRRVLTAILAVAATAGLISGLNGPTQKAEASYIFQHARTLFAPAGNFIVHTISSKAENDLRCLALNVYWEARSESVEGQMAVAAVTLNRVADPHFPNNICSVVRQGGEVRRHQCQFSW